MPKIQYSANRYSITIPMSIMKALSWNKGYEIEWQIRDNKIFLSEVKKHE